MNELIMTNKNNFVARLKLGDYLLGKGLLEGAEVEFQYVLTHNPENKDAEAGLKRVNNARYGDDGKEL